MQRCDPVELKIETLTSVMLGQFAKRMSRIKNGASRVSTRYAQGDDKRAHKYMNAHAAIQQTDAAIQQTDAAGKRPVPVHASPADSNRLGTRKCACHEGCNRLNECDTFLRKNAGIRWKFVTDHNLCKCFLRRHQN